MKKKLIIILGTLLALFIVVFTTIKTHEFRFLIENRTNFYYWENEELKTEKENVENLMYCENSYDTGFECGFYLNGTRLKFGEQQ